MAAATIADFEASLQCFATKLQIGFDLLFEKHSRRLAFGAAAFAVEEYLQDRPQGVSLSDWVTTRLRDIGEIGGHVMGRRESVSPLARWNASIADAITKLETSLETQAC